MTESEKLIKIIIEGIKDKKGEDIVKLDIRKLGSSICDFFVICQADSRVQLQAISDHIVRKVREDIQEHVWQKEGYENAKWILLDFSSVVVHIFESQSRGFYDIENLWADAKLTKIKN